MALDLRIAPGSDTSFTATCSCPCGCTPSVVQERDAGVITDSCCCGNEFAVGPGADGRVASVTDRDRAVAELLDETGLVARDSGSAHA